SRAGRACQASESQLLAADRAVQRGAPVEDPPAHSGLNVIVPIVHSASRVAAPAPMTTSLPDQPANLSLSSPSMRRSPKCARALMLTLEPFWSVMFISPIWQRSLLDPLSSRP